MQNIVKLTESKSVLHGLLFICSSRLKLDERHYYIYIYKDIYNTNNSSIVKVRLKSTSDRNETSHNKLSESYLHRRDQK